MKRFLIMLLAVALLLPLMAMAQEAADWHPAMPMLEETLQQALYEEGLTGSFGFYPIAEEPDEEGQNWMIIGEIFQEESADLPLPGEETARRWLDRRVMFTLQRSQEQTWQVTEVSLQEELRAEEATADALAGLMVEYLNTELGFTVQYPALFTEDTLTTLPNGISGRLSDGTAFSARRIEKRSETLEDYLQTQRQEFSQWTENVNAVTGVVQWMGSAPDGMHRMLAVAEGEDAFWEAVLLWPQERSEAFSLYAEYMTHSLTADESGQG